MRYKTQNNNKNSIGTPYLLSKRKRILDLIVALMGLIVFVLWYPIVIIMIKLSSRGPVFYKRQRVGHNGKLFSMLKFRTMFVGSDTAIENLRTQGDKDTRIIRCGHFMRRFYLDELPQFWHILKGEMSVVGPRPELPELVDELLKIEPKFNNRNYAKPGLTGLAQVEYQHASNTEAAAKRFQYDSTYIASASLRRDFVIILKTIRQAILGKSDKFGILKFLFEEIPLNIKLRFVLNIVIRLSGGLLPVASFGFLGLALLQLGVGTGFTDSTLLGVITDTVGLVGIELTFVSALTISGLLLVANLLLGYFTLIFINIGIRKYELKRTKTITQRLYASNWPYLSDQTLGRIFQIIQQEAREVTNALSLFASFIASSIEGIIYIAAAFWLSWQIAVIILIAQIVNILVNRGFIGWIQRLAEKSLPIRIRYNSRILDAFGDIKAIKANHMEQTVLNRLFPVMDELQKVQISDSFVGTHRSTFNSAWRFIIVAASVTVSAFLIGLSTELIVLFVLIAPIVVSRISALINTITNWTRLRVSFDATQTLMHGASVSTEQTTGAVAGKLRRGVQLKNVSFSYPTYKQFNELGQPIETETEIVSPEVVKNVNLEIQFGSIVALVGHSGAGKTTILDLLTGLLRPKGGHILFDDKNYDDINIHSLRDQIAYVAQSTILFNDTLENNLRLLKPEATQNELDTACRRAQIYDFIQTLPDKYGTVIGDRGVKLSGGQAQRIAIARGLLKDFSILILDESTSNLDVSTEEDLMNMIYSLHGTITTILSVHRITAAMRADKIFFFEDGKLVESGKPYDLVNLKGYFYSYWRKFYGDKETEAKIEKGV